MTNRLILGLLGLSMTLLAPKGALADDPVATSKAIEGELGVFVYPKNDQDAAKQDQDASECYASAKDRTGIDLSAPPPEVAATAPKRGGALKGAARGAARGAAAGEIANDDAGDGAAIGAAGGAVRGRRQQKKANAAAQQQATQQAAAAADERKATFGKAFAACMDARDYSVK